MSEWKPMSTAPKDRPLLLWVTRIGTIPPGPGGGWEPAAVVGRWERFIERWRLAPSYFDDNVHDLFPTLWAEIPEPPKD